jgi:secreted trypsin-like serine protease
MVAHPKLNQINNGYVGDFSLLLSNNAKTGGTCFGDSGGPVFYQDSNVIVAVVSWGQTPCIGVDYQFRTDIKTTQDFVGSLTR